MHNTDSPLIDQQKLSRPEILKRVTALCDELEELIMLHTFYYRAAECVFNDNELPGPRGLSVFPHWLRERDTDVLTTVDQLQQALRVTQ